MLVRVYRGPRNWIATEVEDVGMDWRSRWLSWIRIKALGVWIKLNKCSKSGFISTTMHSRLRSPMSCCAADRFMCWFRFPS